MERVAIIGAGVSGLTCGVCFAEAGYQTTILAKEAGQRTTSAAAGAIWYPYDVEPLAAAIRWSLQTYETLFQLSHIPASGVSMIELRTFSRRAQIQIPEWAIALGAQLLPPSVSSVSAEPGRAAGSGDSLFLSGFTLTVPLTDTTIYLDYLKKRLLDHGGSIREGISFKNLDDVGHEFDLVVNCSGIGAKELVPDITLEPHRGQVAIVSKLALSHAVVCDDAPLMYAIPRSNDCLFGGSNELSDNREVDSAMTDRIVAGCSRVLNIDAPQVIAERVGLRPFRRSGICLRADQLGDGRTVLHNYGHGGSGFTLSWGCAAEVLALAKQQ